jgi:hypothetical protein
MQLNRYVQRGGRRGRREQFGPGKHSPFGDLFEPLLCVLCASAFEISLPFNCMEMAQHDCDVGGACISESVKSASWMRPIPSPKA